MLHYAFVFQLVALIAGTLGHIGIAAAAAGMAQILFVVFIALLAVSLIYNRRRNACRMPVSRAAGKYRSTVKWTSPARGDLAMQVIREARGAGKVDTSGLNVGRCNFD